jgi:hypothetical protein
VVINQTTVGIAFHTQNEKLPIGYTSKEGKTERRQPVGSEYKENGVNRIMNGRRQEKGGLN